MIFNKRQNKFVYLFSPIKLRTNEVESRENLRKASLNPNFTGFVKKRVFQKLFGPLRNWNHKFKAYLRKMLIF